MVVTVPSTAPISREGKGTLSSCGVSGRARLAFSPWMLPWKVLDLEAPPEERAFTPISTEEKAVQKRRDMTMAILQANQRPGWKSAAFPHSTSALAGLTEEEGKDC